VPWHEACTQEFRRDRGDGWREAEKNSLKESDYE
jgi:hypothetical protein